MFVYIKFRNEIVTDSCTDEHNNDFSPEITDSVYLIWLPHLQKKMYIFSTQ